MHEMFLRSPIDDGVLHLGITVTNSCFQMVGQTRVVEMALKMSVKGTASRPAYLLISERKCPP